MDPADTVSPTRLLTNYRLPGSPVFMVGTFDKGITVLSQQVRALNLAWALVESGEVALDASNGHAPGTSHSSRKRIAVVGAGFAGLTVAAGLLKKRVNADITVFERRDTVMPLQHGSDSRWLHPHIYDWPSQGSEAYSAALPVLNWTASRASDVVVQVLSGWRDVARAKQTAPEGINSEPPELRLYCNTRHLLIRRSSHPSQMEIEWIGEERDRTEPALPAADQPAPSGESDKFDVVILAVGFGLETDSATYYWRNDTLAQPQLGQARSTYIVSGSGDGAMVDLFRLRISHFRQDRILAELFSGRADLLRTLREVKDRSDTDETTFESLRAIWENPVLADSTSAVQGRLRARLRQDTDVLLRVRNPSFTNLFVDKRVSFQNRLLAYLLYRCGAFTPVTADSDKLGRLAREHGVPDGRIIIRHGTEKKAGLTDVLDASLHEEVERCLKEPDKYFQTDRPAWSGGYFDMPGLLERTAGTKSPHTTNAVRAQWRREYLPSPTEAIATAFCAAVAGYITSVRAPSARLRVTLHRTLATGDEVVLQQCCDYQGPQNVKGRAGRTFPSSNGTIGAAFTLGQVVRTRDHATHQELITDMEALSLDEASQKMADAVASVAAIPILGPADADLGQEAGRNVVGVLYLDSYDEGAFGEDDMMRRVIEMAQTFFDSLPRASHTAAARIANTEFWVHASQRPGTSSPVPDPDTWQALEAVLEPPTADHLRQINFDFSDFTPVEDS
ncbi:hypothetical protein ASG49_16190 [Marmoricola sp. Leaf446]|uniref:FAD-dependent oxidoreductase n=1 Tax=Marmoricola sp. Leaf446 TaxID=1736379 RepID=UPI0007006A6F|nr:FAD-dependent oxidoreductase [Marmoricola sp. Leaf446]KQT89320.1 hypothetical protein ASG49_16190 [Marmoricola sp. Leaf446]